LLRYIFSILLFIIVIGIGYTYDFNSFAFHTPGSGYTIINGQVYANNGTDNTLDPLFVQRPNGTATNANMTLPQPMNGTATNANMTLPQPMNGTATNANMTLPQPMNGTQDITSSTLDIIYHLNLARQAVELGNPRDILKELDLVEQQLYFVAKNATSDFSTMSDSSSNELEGSEEESEAKQDQPEDTEEKVPVDEQLPRASSTRDDTPQRTRAYQ